MVDRAMEVVIQKSSGMAGVLFGVKAGKLGLGLGLFIWPMGLIGAIGTSLDNWSKWQNAFISGDSLEKAGALTALTGDIGSIGVNAIITAKAGAEVAGLIADTILALPNARETVMSAGWATRGSRFLLFSMRMTPLGLLFTALQLSGEALYNFSNIDDQQRWMLACCWGVKPKDWDWPTHSQKLAEATLLPQIIDKGIEARMVDGEHIRTLHLVLPGLRLSTFNDASLRWTAQLQKAPDVWDAGEALSSLTSVIADNPMTLALQIPDQWHDAKALLELRLAVRPPLAAHYLKEEAGHLHYRIALSRNFVSRKPITASAVTPPLVESLKEVQITRKLLNEYK